MELHKLLRVSILLLPHAVFAAAAPQVISTDQDFRYSFETSEVDFRSDIAELNGNVRVVQGLNSIEAQRATVNAFRSENSQWVFREQVRVLTAEAELKSQTAKAIFKDEQLTEARAEGTPAQFQSVGATGKATQARGRARLIEYDLSNETVRLTGDVWFGYGKDEFRGDTIVYYLRDERVVVNPPGEPAGRVRGVIRPKPRADQSPSSTPSAAVPNISEDVSASGARLSSETGA
jgi:lipopolysaccharide transport protein LptA